MDNKKSEKPGKGLEAFYQELEFIYKRIEKEPMSQIIDELIDGGFPVRSEGFIKRRKKEFTAAKKVIGMQTEGAFDTDDIERRKRHRVRLSDRAQELLMELQEFFPYTNPDTLEDYVYATDDFSFANLITDFRSQNLFDHLKSEIPEFKNLKEWKELKINSIQSSGLLDVLGRVAEQQQIKHKCDTCKDWDKKDN